jgi:FkbM family methyltransferase
VIAEAAHLLGGPFDTVIDVGGNVGGFAAEADDAWPLASVYSFEPVPELAAANLERAAGRWQVYTLAISRAQGEAELRVCVNQHSASTMQPPGSARKEHFKIADKFDRITVPTASLDDLIPYVDGRLLVKIDVEGHEGAVLQGGHELLGLAETVICEVQNDPSVFVGAPRPHEVDARMFAAGLCFAGVAGALLSPGSGGVLQFDGVWRRTLAPSGDERLGIRPLHAV